MGPGSMAWMIDSALAATLLLAIRVIEALSAPRVSAPAAPAPAPIDYTQDIRPILADGLVLSCTTTNLVIYGEVVPQRLD